MEPTSFICPSYFSSSSNCSEIENCQVWINGLGCVTCESGYFQGSDYGCVSCEEAFGDACLSCEDNIGCTACKCGYTLTYDPDCDVYYCELTASFPPTPIPVAPLSLCPPAGGIACPTSPCDCTIDTNCDNCQSWGCSQCDIGYFKRSFSHNCESCAVTYSNRCLSCADWIGCTSCAAGYTLQWDSACGVWDCV